MLIGNGSHFLKNPGRLVGANFQPLSVPAAWWQSGALRNRFTALPQTAAQPRGYRPPYGWIIPIKSGELGSNTTITGTAGSFLALAGGRNGVAALSGAGTLDAIGQTVASLIAALSGSGLVSDADIRAMLNGLATLVGTSGGTADLDALAWADALLAGAAALGLEPYATGQMDAEIIPGSVGDTLTPGQIADAVWNAAVAAYQSAGTMGEVQDNGSGSFPGGQFWP